MRDVEGSITRQLAEYATATSRIQRYCRSWAGPVDRAAKSGPAHWLQMTFPYPRASLGCFPERWGHHRFEPIGDVFLIPAGEVFHARSECRQQQSIAFLLSPDAITEWCGGEWVLTNKQLEACLNIVNPTIRNLLSRLGDEISNPGLASRTLLEAMSVEIAVELFRHFVHVGENESAGALAPWRLRLIDERLAEIDESPSLKELAQLCNISVRHLTRGFRVSRGVSIGSCVAASRIEYAKRLLKSDTCVKSIAFAMGFTSPSNFSAAFRRATGQSPRQYRQSMGSDEEADAESVSRLS